MFTLNTLHFRSVVSSQCSVLPYKDLSDDCYESKPSPGEEKAAHVGLARFLVHRLSGDCLLPLHAARFRGRARPARETRTRKHERLAPPFATGCTRWIAMKRYRSGSFWLPLPSSLLVSGALNSSRTGMSGSNNSRNPHWNKSHPMDNSSQHKGGCYVAKRLRREPHPHMGVHPRLPYHRIRVLALESPLRPRAEHEGGNRPLRNRRPPCTKVQGGCCI